MCYANPTESLAIARARLTPEQWAKFEADFEHCCDHGGLHAKTLIGVGSGLTVDWAKWFYLCGKGL